MSSSELKPIVLYDIPCIIPGRPWSPNTMKTRYCLGYKRLPFTTVWVELPDIAGLLQSKGITHTPYTLPAIEDPNTGKVVVDSLAIATYLDETYPETPKVLSPAATRMLEVVEAVFSFVPKGGAAPNTTAVTGASAGVLGDCGKADGPPDLAPRLVFIVLACKGLNPVSRAHYNQMRTARLGERWTTIFGACSASPEDRAERVRQGIEAITGAWREVTALYDRQNKPEEGESGGPFALGKEPSFVDFAVAGRIKFAVDKLIPSEAKALTGLEGGRLGRLVEDLERYYKY